MTGGEISQTVILKLRKALSGLKKEAPVMLSFTSELFLCYGQISKEVKLQSIDG
ncbi:hypothetical protein M1N11_00065 [Peptococcaceae bacterium]|nr:hypothetical protein [Peptococcaceae bacterium]